MNEVTHFLNSFLQEGLGFTKENIGQFTFISDRKNIVDIIQKRGYKRYIKESYNTSHTFSFYLQVLKQIEDLPLLTSGWELEHQNLDGSIIASKDGCRRFLRAGKYITEERIDGSYVSFHSSNFFYKNGFFQVFGNYIDEVFPFQLCRIYFNLKPKYIINWVNLMLEILNSQDEYFHFKFIVEHKGENRADNAVLYIKREQFNKLAKRIIANSKKFVADEVPLFTRCLAPGIAFAENPPDPNESFGTSRCRLIAEAMVEAHEKGIEDVKEYVLQHIESKGYDLDRFYLNPGSGFVSDFSAFE